MTIQTIDPATIEKRLGEAEKQKEKASQEEDYEKAAYYRDQISHFTKLKNQQVADDEMPTVSEKDMEETVELKTGIPVGELKEKEASQLKTLESDLQAHVIGQDEAIEKVAKAIRRNRIGLNKRIAQLAPSYSSAQLVLERQS